jgi:hypothetical protein
VSLLPKLCRCQQKSLLRELGRDRDRSARSRLPGRRLQSGGDLGVRPFRSQRQVSRLFLRIGHGGGQAPVNGTPRARRRGSEMDRGQQRMREADLLAVELDQPGGGGPAEVALCSLG